MAPRESDMQPRLKYWTIAPEAVKRMMGLNSYLEKSNIEARLRLLVQLRVSQMNGCAYCIDLHTREALRHGEKPQRLHCLTLWRETDLFTPRERAALAFAESITRVAETHVPDADYNDAAQHFNQKDLVDLTLVISTMNAWNRMAISFRRPVAELRARE
jgi:AhpD family alkylhydroperoxidase